MSVIELGTPKKQYVWQPKGCDFGYTQEITQAGGGMGKTGIHIEKSRSSRLYFGNVGDGDCGVSTKLREDPAEIGRVDTSGLIFTFITFIKKFAH